MLIKYIMYILILCDFAYFINALITTLKAAKKQSNVIQKKFDVSLTKINNKHSINPQNQMYAFNPYVDLFQKLNLLFLLLIFFAPIVIPILITVDGNPVLGFIVFAIASAIGAYLKLIVIKIRTMNNKKYMELGLLSEILIIFLFFQILVLFADPLNFSVNILINLFYNLTFKYKIELMVFIPTLFYSLLSLNFYILFKKVRYDLKKDIEKYNRINKSNILLTLVLTSFIGLFFLNNLDKSFMSEAEIEVYKGAINIFSILLSAILIPLLLNKLNYKKQS